MARPREPRRREELLDAAVQAAASVGVSGLTVKDVASTAGVSTGTIHYHFDDVDGLLRGVVERSLDQMYHQRLAAIAEVGDLRAKLVLLIDLGVPDELSHEVTLLYEAVGVVRSRDRLAAVIKSYVERQVSLYRSVIDAGIAAGVFTPAAPVDTIARNLLALEDAYDLYRATDVVRDGSTGRRNLRSYAALALGCELDD